MNPSLAHEAARLARSWQRHEEPMLRDYLVAGGQDPRVNPQSILARHWLLEALLGERLAALRNEELRFGVVLGWLLGLAQKASGPEECRAVHYALRRGADNAEGLEIPPFVLQAFQRLPVTVDEVTVPNYVRNFLAGQDRRASGAAAVAPTPPASGGEGGQGALEKKECGKVRTSAGTLDTFQRLWRCRLGKEPPRGYRVLEPACGSANDYRSWHAFGLARLVDYTGFDLCEKNIRNAQRLFPRARFEVGNAFATGYADKAFDYCLVQDLLEHLSLEALEAAIRELCRVTRTALFVGCFNLYEGGEPIIRPVGEYHWNTLSLPWLKERFGRHGATVQAIHINTFLRSELGCDAAYNDNAYNLRVWL